MMFSRAFTLPEANALVPLLEESLGRVHAQFLEARALHDAIDSAKDAGPAHKQLTVLERQMATSLAELTTWGVTVQALDPPLVEVPADREGRRVALSWQLGEPAFQHWHANDEVARHPIATGDDFGVPILH
jgi:hypothetical protein